jgi:Holliday junction resolvasome RuvABC DNA-binding subunit
METENKNESQPTAEELRVFARDQVHIHLGNPTGQAQTMVETLDDAEVKAIVDAGNDRQTAREAIKSVFSSAYDRRQREHAAAATANQSRLETRRKACHTLAAAGVTTEQTQAALKQLSDGELSILANLDGETDVKEVVQAVLKRARDRTQAAPLVEPPAELPEPATESMVESAAPPAEPQPEPPAEESKPAAKPAAKKK